MNYYKNTAMLFIILLLTASVILGQYKEDANQSGVGIPFFRLATHQQFEDDLEYTKLIVMTQFLYDDLTFIKQDTFGYFAEFELLVAVYDSKDNVVLSQTLHKNVNVNDFAATNSRTEKVLQKTSMRIQPGKYQLFVKASDLNSDKTAQRKTGITIQDYTAKPINIGGVLFIKEAKFNEDGELIDFVPSFGNNFSVRSGSFYIYTDIYNASWPDEVRLRYILSPEKSGNEIDTTIRVRVKDNVSSHLFRIDKKLLKFNKYKLETIVSSSEGTAKKVQPFSFFWTDVPSSEMDIKTALDQMIYFAPPDSLNRYKEASLEEQRKFFKRFWAEYDPDPTTAKNELKNEYFKRVNFSDQNFSILGQNGWTTDRGRILIKFGFPDDIDRHPFELGSKPYEVWKYYALRKTFLFEDMTGFGDYRLNPAFFEEEFK